MTAKKKTLSVGVFLFLICLSFLVLFPFGALVLASLNPAAELMRFGLNLHIEPEKLSLNNYRYLFSEEARLYLQWFKNSVLLTVLSTIVTLFFSSMVGYALAIYRFKGRNFILGLVVFVMMIPVEIMMLPMFKEMISFHLINTYWGVILPFAVSPFAVFFFRQFTLGLPKELLDAARIDGCSEFGIFFRVMAPLMIPAFGAMGILQALNSWNNFLWPLIVLRTNDMLNLPIGLSGLLTPYGNNYNILISGSVLTVLPMLVLFLFFQRFFIAGLTVGGVKG
ncbi:carbohydrate ABC transporter permease [Paenactinomyces guangxiensis]|uniref:Carbohydrate ABC transporter permease n=1 Tax=Paenactinomyces guangxiensis TaxID=1490290 RepID=A0A7W1WN90_9BACL|nr:carbohydrate ABC transporter permease [Paenactinomyces guangxiensis]MBA4493047.1 carbohydrate ABC transporter permease [Paenactinomyces guangxiensis]MBH8590104.1 carbohydrate ABC transporter permease [Paenactinomyces guangxiensis]